MEPAVFLDRDDTLIANDGDLGDPELVRLLDGVPEGLRALREAGYRLVVVTNQGGVARGKYTEADVDAVNQRIALLVDEAAGARGLIDRFYYCPYHPRGTVEAYRRDHPWRKPGAGMLLQAAHDMSLDLASSWMVGDQPRDVTAGQAAGARTILCRADAIPEKDLRPTALADSFAAAVSTILGRRSGERSAASERNPTADGTDEPAMTVMTELKPTVAAPAPATTVAAPAVAPPPAAVAAPDQLIRTMAELTEELRSQRQRGAEFTSTRMIAVITQLAALAMAVMGLLQLETFELFARWMIGAAVAQLLVATLLVADLKG